MAITQSSLWKLSLLLGILVLHFPIHSTCKSTLFSALERLDQLEEKVKFLDLLTQDRVWKTRDNTYIVEEDVRMSFERAVQHCESKNGKMVEISGNTDRQLAYKITKLQVGRFYSFAK